MTDVQDAIKAWFAEEWNENPDNPGAVFIPKRPRKWTRTDDPELRAVPPLDELSKLAGRTLMVAEVVAVMKADHGARSVRLDGSPVLPEGA